MELSYNKSSKYYALFIVVALFPQIFGFGGTATDELWKILAIVLLAVKTYEKTNGVYLTSKGMTYILLYLCSSICILLVNAANPLNDMLNALLRIVLVYLLFDTPNRLRREPKDVLTFYSIYSHFILVACIYNMIIHFESMLNIVAIDIYGSEEICSFFDNKNTFGAFLMLGFLATMIMYINTRKKKWYLYMMIIFINEIMAMCRTAIFITVALFVIIMLWDKEKRIRNILMIGIVILVVLNFMQENQTVFDFVNGKILGDTRSLDTRQDYVSEMKKLLNGIHLMFGYGQEQSAQLAIRYTGNRYYHNMYLHIFMIGGIVEFLFWGWMVVSSCIISFRVYKKSKSWGMLCFCSILTYLVYGTVESVILFNTPVIAMTVTMFIVTMPIIINKKMEYEYSRKRTIGEKNNV